MTTKASTKSNYSPVIHNGLYNAKLNSKFSVLIFALNLLGIPLVLINTMYNLSAGKDTIPDDSFIVVAAGAIFLSGIFGIVIAMVNFRYLYNKNQVDMCLSQPLSMKQRFFSDYLSGLASYIIPFVLSQIFTGILLLVGHLAYDGRTFAIKDYYGLELYSYTCTFFEDIAAYIGRIIFSGIFIMLMLYTITVLVNVCCGSICEAILYNVLLNAAVPGVIYLMYDNDPFGINLSYAVTDLLCCTSPAGGLAELILCGTDRYTYFTAANLWVWLAAYIAVTAVVFILAYFLYKKRRAEQVSTPFVFRGLYSFIITLALIGLLSFFYHIFEKIEATAIIVSAAVYILLEIASRRGLKKIWQGIIRYAVTAGAFIGLVFIADKTFFFGMITRVPEASSVEKVYIGYGGIYNTYNGHLFEHYNNIADKINNNEICTITDPANIQCIVNAHQSIVDRYAEGKSKDNYYRTYDVWNAISISYELKNGTRLTRHYEGFTFDTVDAIKALDISEEYKQYYADDILSKLNSENYNEVVSLKEFDHNNNNDAYDPIYDSRPLISAFGSDERVGVPEEFYCALGNALARDIMSRNADNYFTPSEKNYWFAIEYARKNEDTNDNYYVSSIAFNLNDSWTETTRLLKEYGYLDNNGYKNDYYADAEKFQQVQIEIKICRPEAYPEAYEKNTVYAGGSYNTSEIQGRYVLEDSRELEDVLAVMQEAYITEKPCYTIVVSGKLYVIPPEYSEAAEKLYNISLDPTGYGENYSFYYGRGIVDTEGREFVEPDIMA